VRGLTAEERHELEEGLKLEPFERDRFPTDAPVHPVVDRLVERGLMDYLVVHEDDEYWYSEWQTNSTGELALRLDALASLGVTVTA